MDSDREDAQLRGSDSIFKSTGIESEKAAFVCGAGGRLISNLTFTEGRRAWIPAFSQREPELCTVQRPHPRAAALGRQRGGDSPTPEQEREGAEDGVPCPKETSGQG